MPIRAGWLQQPDAAAGNAGLQHPTAQSSSFAPGADLVELDLWLSFPNGFHVRGCGVLLAEGAPEQWVVPPLDDAHSKILAPRTEGLSREKVEEAFQRFDRKQSLLFAEPTGIDEGS
jgi:hypothetical protein